MALNLAKLAKIAENGHIRACKTARMAVLPHAALISTKVLSKVAVRVLRHARRVHEPGQGTRHACGAGYPDPACTVHGVPGYMGACTRVYMGTWVHVHGCTSGTSGISAFLAILSAV